MGKRKKRSGCLRTIGIMAGTACVLFMIVILAIAGGKIKEEIKEGVQKAAEIPFQEVNVSDEELARKYYYQQISDGEKTAYKDIVQGVRENTEDIYVHSSDADRTNVLFQYVLNDFPEIFWCNGTTKCISYEGAKPYTVLKPLYLYGTQEKEQKKSEIEAGVNEYLARVDAQASDYEKICYVYETIVNTVDYDLNAPDNQNIYSVFVNKTSVCAGYSKATQYLLERMGVFCTYVTGTVGEGEGEGHAWNLVQCEGDYYYVDTTWGDPVFQGSEEEQAIAPDYISYDYLCCNEEELFRTHTPDAGIPLPVCTKMDYNYYVVNGMYYTEYDGETVLKAMNDVIASGGNPSVIKFANQDLYTQGREDIFENQIARAAQNLAQWYGLSEVKYQYLDDVELNKITIYWRYQ